MQYASVLPVGRGEGYQAYLGTSNREITLRIQFHVQGIHSTDVTTTLFEREVIQPTRFLDALKSPVNSEQQNLSYPPPPCILKIGALFTGRVIVTAGDVTWMPPWDPDLLLPHGSEVRSTFRVVRRFQPDLGYRFNGIWV